MLRSRCDGRAYGLPSGDSYEETEEMALETEGGKLGYIVRSSTMDSL